MDKHEVRSARPSVIVATILLGTLSCATACATPSIGSIIVDTSRDGFAEDHACTLREAVENAADHSRLHPDCASGGDDITDIRFGLDPGTHQVVDEINLEPYRSAMIVKDGVVRIHGPVTAHLPPGVPNVGQFVVKPDALLVLNDVTLEYGDASEGGLIYDEGALEMHGGAARFGSAGSGGAIAVRGIAWLDGVELSANTADDGGALYVHSNANVFIENARFFANAARGEGGALAADDVAGNLTIHRSSFIANRADGDFIGGGGAIYALGTVRIEDSVIAENVANGLTGGGGADFAFGANVAIVNVEFRDNRVGPHPTASGGGVLHRGLGHITISRSNFDGNIAWVGAGAFVGANSTLELDNSTLTRNFADSTAMTARPDAGRGAAIYADSSTLVLRNATIKDNEGLSQLGAAGGAEMRFANTVVWAPQGVANCGGQATYVNLGSSMQNPDASGASCALTLLGTPESSVFAMAMSIFDSPSGPPASPVMHSLWLPRAGGPLSKAGAAATCLDAASVDGIDERLRPRPAACDVGAAQGL